MDSARLRLKEGEKPERWNCGRYNVLFCDKLPKDIQARLPPQMTQHLPKKDRITVTVKSSQEGKEDGEWEFPKRRKRSPRAQTVSEGQEQPDGTATKSTPGNKRERERSTGSNAAAQGKRGKAEKERRECMVDEEQKQEVGPARRNKEEKEKSIGSVAADQAKKFFLQKIEMECIMPNKR